MKRMKSAALIPISVVAALQLAGCAVGSYQARSVDVREAYLVNPDILVKRVGDEESLYRYLNPKADFKKYSRIMIDPVLVRKDGELAREDLENYQKLANNAYVYLAQELGKNYPLVTSPEPGAMRVQMALIDADSSQALRNTTSTLLPIGMALSLVKYGVTGKQTGVGEITGEMKITDAMSGELLGAALDRRVGGKELTKLWSDWHNADDGLQYWAKRLGFVLCTMRGDENCVKPQAGALPR